MNKQIPALIGWLGAIILLAGFALISFGLLPADSYAYLSLNVIGSIFIIISSTNKKDYPSAALNVVWAIIALVAIGNLLLK